MAHMLGRSCPSIHACHDGILAGFWRALKPGESSLIIFFICQTYHISFFAPPLSKSSCCARHRYHVSLFLSVLLLPSSQQSTLTCMSARPIPPTIPPPHLANCDAISIPGAPSRTISNNPH